MSLAIVLPKFGNRQGTLRSLREIDAFFSGPARDIGDIEIIVVDDGSHPSERLDDTDFANFHRKPCVLQLPENHGKGFAVGVGMRATRAQYRIFTDCDLPFGCAPILQIYETLKNDHVAFVGAQRALQWHWGYEGLRMILSFGFRMLFGGFLFSDRIDTQCGLKGFRGDFADFMFTHLSSEKFSFDIEIYLYLTQNQIDYRVQPVFLENQDASSIRLMRDGRRFLTDVLRMSVRKLQNGYKLTDDLIARLQPMDKSGRNSKTANTVKRVSG